MTCISSTDGRAMLGRLWRGLYASLAIVLVLVISGTADAAAERRVALVIGNSAYAEAPLRNPVNDARAMAATLRELNFDVMLLENADRTRMQRAALEFGRKLSEDVAGLFYFSGHGMQVQGINYLIPINAQVASAEEVEVEALDVNYILARMATAKNRFNIVILDACRNNPFERSFRSASSGLAAISAPRGTLIAYATAPGSVAADGQGANGLYTGELVAALKVPNQPLEQTFKQARSEVVTKSSGKQTPWESSSVIGDFIFRPQVKPGPIATPRSENAEAALWAAVKDSQAASDYHAYLDAFPNGVYAPLARRRIEGLAAPQGKPAVAAAATAPQSAPAAKKTDPVVSDAKQPAPSAGTQVAALMPPAGRTEPRQLQDYALSNWPAIQAAIRKFFADPDNLWYLSAQSAQRDTTRVQIHSVDYHSALSHSDAGLEVVALLKGQVPSTIITGSLTGYSSYTKVLVDVENGQFVVRQFAVIPKHTMSQKEKPDQSKVTP
ncbi:MAG: caspase family protein [Ferrovibrio sp.]|uniref:caspase family protein n=1 Tax=Ferrovibrio sp. TaxID=1917215 RepID=UPI002630B327|nr:caspase family protein [Ferrovibrio sp.]MCW0234514.1 caspase family protein [Ferrovibrio sp.]